MPVDTFYVPGDVRCLLPEDENYPEEIQKDPELFAHRGLLFYKYIRGWGESNGARKISDEKRNGFLKLVGDTLSEAVGDGLTALHDRRMNWPDIYCRDWPTQSRLVVGLGAESVLETGMILHRILGVPYIPGSAVKGLCRASAELIFDKTPLATPERNKNAEPDTTARQIFGTPESVGLITFHDAFPDQNPKLIIDVMTPHYGDYYNAPENEVPAPADWSSPNPITFLVVEAGATFQFPLQGPEELAEKAFEWLEGGLTYLGIGAKTSSGYGFFRIQEEITSQDVDAVASLRDELTAVDTASFPSELSRFYQKWENLQTEEEKHAVAHMILEKLGEKFIKRKRKKHYMQELLKYQREK